MWILLLGCTGGAKEAVEDSAEVGDSGEVASGRDSGETGDSGDAREEKTPEWQTHCIDTRAIDGVYLGDPSTLGGQIHGISITAEGGDSQLVVGWTSYGEAAHILRIPTVSSTSLDELWLADFPSHASGEPYTPHDIDGDGVLDGLAIWADWDRTTTNHGATFNYAGDVKLAWLPGPVLDNPSTVADLDLGHIEVSDFLAKPREAAEGGAFDATPGAEVLASVTDFKGRQPAYAWLIDAAGSAVDLPVNGADPAVIGSAGDLDGDGIVDVFTSYPHPYAGCVLGFVSGPLGDSIADPTSAGEVVTAPGCRLTDVRIALGDVTGDGLGDVGFTERDSHFFAGPIKGGRTDDVAFLTVTQATPHCLVDGFESGDLGADGTMDLLEDYTCSEGVDGASDFHTHTAIFSGYPHGTMTECDASLIIEPFADRRTIAPAANAILPTGVAWFSEHDYDNDSSGYWLADL